MKKQITVIPLGPGDPQLLTLASADALRTAKRLVLRTERHGAAAWLRENGIAYESLDALYEQYEDFDALHAAMAERLWRMAADGPLAFGVMDPATDGAVAALLNTVGPDDRVTCLAGLNATDACLALIPAAMRCGDGLRVIPANRVTEASPDPHLGLMVTEIDDRMLAGDVKLTLTELYRDEQEVLFFPPSEKAQRTAVRIPLAEADRQKRYDQTVCLYVPASPLMERERYCFRDLVDIMELLRGENGCPWDREQTHESLCRYLIEEAWEAVGAVREDDPEHLADELGDVLLQIVFHASIGRSHGTFAIGDVTTAICR